MSSHTASAGSLSTLGIAAASLRHYPRLLWPIALGIAAAAATILGAMFIGDSLRGSLRSIALDRIGRIEHVLLAPNFFRQDLLSEAAFAEAYGGVELPAIVFPATSLELRDGDRLSRAGGVLLMAVTDDYWSVGELDAPPPLGEQEVVLNQAAAAELGVAVGDAISVQLPEGVSLSSDSPLGKREAETVILANRRVSAILPDRSIGGFSLRASQTAPLTAFISLAAAQDALGRTGEVNASLLAYAQQENAQEIESARDAAASLLDTLRPSLADLGLALRRHTLRAPEGDATVFDYFQLSSDSLLLSDEVVETTRRELGEANTAVLFTYLANAIEPAASRDDSHEVPYSTVTGLDAAIAGPEAEPWQLKTDAALPPMGPDECWINRWLAEDLGVGVGDELRVAYFESELQSGAEVERTFSARVAGVVPLTEPSRPYRRNRDAAFDEPPTAFNDPAMTPAVEGITDQESIDDWDTPFPLTRQTRGEDDEYWANYRLTPKMYLPLARARELFGSRFGDATSIRIDPTIAESEEALAGRLAATLSQAAPSLGWQVIPLRASLLEAASGTTPFDVLFLSLSFFVIAAALMLVFLLIRLAVEGRQSQWGLLMATGWPSRRVRGLILAESALLIAGGCVIGLGLGVAFCWAVLELFRGRWGGAVVNASLEFHWSAASVAIGTTAAAATALATIWFSLRWLARRSSLSLLRQNASAEAPSLTPVEARGLKTSPVSRTSGLAKISASPRPKGRLGRGGLIATLVTAIAAPAIGATAFGLEGPARAGAFLGAGAVVLIGHVYVFYAVVSAEGGGAGLRLLSLAASSMRRNRVRSLLAVSLVAVASFLLVSVSLFHLEPEEGGTGGYEYLARTDLPIARDLNDPTVRRNALGSERVRDLEGTSIVGMRLRAGDDASCNNLFQADQPQVLGVPASIGRQLAVDGGAGGFDWAAVEQEGDEGRPPWDALQRSAAGTVKDPLPVVLDQNTALWALHLKGRVGERFAYRYDDREVHFRTVGLLQNTILQGYLVVGESNFTRVFPSVSGRRMFLVDSPREKAQAAASALERGWANEGFDATETAAILRGLLAVQNTYLRAFQSLGALGLVLGTLGLAVIQFRSVMERRGEIGLLQAVGFAPRRVAAVLLTEHTILLAAGAAIGLAGSTVSIALAYAGGQNVGRFIDPIAMLAAVLLIGTVVGLLAIRRSLRLPLIASLRS